MAAIETRLTGSALGALIGLLCCMLLIIGFLDFEVGLLVSAAALGVAWIVLCVYQPLLAFSILLLVFVLAYTRFGALGDLLWLGLVPAVVVKRVLSFKTIKFRKNYPVAIWFMLPFILMTTIFPVVGILKRQGRVYTKIVPDVKSATLIPILERKVIPDSIVYTNSWHSYNVLDVSDILPCSD